MLKAKKLQMIVFQKMYNFQKGVMASQIIFAVYQTLKWSFKDIFIITMLIFPLQDISHQSRIFFQMMEGYNTIATIFFGILMGLFIFMFLTKLQSFQEKFKNILQTFLPWIDVFSFGLVSIQISFLMTNMNTNFFLASLNIFTIIALSFIHIFYNLFNFTKEPRSKNLFKKREARIVSLSNIIILFLIIYISIRYFSGPLSQDQKMIYSIFQLLLSLIKIKEKVIKQHYLNAFSQTVSSGFYFLQISFCLVTTMIYSFHMTLVETNMIFIIVLIASLSYIGLNAYNIHRKALVFLSNASTLKNEDEALMYLDRMCELISIVQKQGDDVILASLKKKHSLICRDEMCECQKTKVNIKAFIISYVKSEIQEMSKIYNNSPFIIISLLYFKMAIFKYYPQILAKLNYLSTHFNLTITERYYRYCLSQYVIEFINKRNYEILAVESEHMFKLEEIRKELQVMIKGDIETRSKTWKYLSRGLCRVSELEHNCNISLKYISKISLIYEANKVKFKKSKQFNLLLLFYFLKVSFLNNGKDIRQNLKQLYYGYKQDQLYTLKEFRRFIYHKRSCVIQTLIDTKIMGIITGASRNVEEMFGFPNNKIIGLSINALMPQFMADQHGPIMDQWSKSGTWRTIGKLKEVFCIHKEQYCFQALLYLKIYIKDNSMHFITNIFKLNESDFLIINPDRKIQGLGRKFYKILGEPAKRMNVELLIQNDGSMFNHQIALNETKVYRKIFMSLKNLQSEVDNYLQAVNLQFDEKQKNDISLEFHKMLTNVCQQKYLVEFSMKRQKMGKISFLVLGLKEAKRIQKQQTLRFIQKMQYKMPIVRGEMSKDLLDFEAVQSEENSFQRNQEEDLILGVDGNANSSMTSLSQKQNYPLTKTIEKFLKITQDPLNIVDSRLNNFNYFLVFLLILLSLINFFSFYCYKEILMEIEGIFFADGAQSDVMQTTEIAYSAIYSLKSQIYNSTPQTFNSTLASARFVNNYVYSLSEYNFQNLIKSVTQLTKERLYSYLQKPSKWKLRGSETSISTFQFLENMFYLSGAIYNQLERVNLSPNKTINLDYFNELFHNFPQMQRLNQYYLTEYQGVSDYQHQFAINLIYVSTALYFAISLILSILINRYLKFRFSQLLTSFGLFSLIPSQFLQKLKEYYSLLISSIIDKEYLESIDIHEDYVFDVDTYDLFHKSDVNKNGLSSKIKFINYEHYYKWILVIIFFGMVNGINYLAAKQIINFFPASKQVITQVNQLMRSENKLLQSYFYLKSSYYMNPQKYINNQLYDKIFSYLNQTTVKFDEVSNKLVNVFNQYDATYEDFFVDSLVSNVCMLSSIQGLSDFQNAKCKAQLKLNILDGGILISMNFFETNVRNCLEDFRLTYIQKTKQPYKGDYFLQIQFTEIDKMLIYMFKIYQLTQAISFNSYIVAIKVISDNYLQLIIGIFVFYVLIVLVWLRSIPSQKQNLAKLFGHLLLIPFPILKGNMRITKCHKDSIQYEDF